MEVALSEPLRKGTPLPLSQLVEESRSRASIPNHLLDSKIYIQLRGNSQIQAEPPELHFSGFKLGESYVKILKLLNISSEVVNIHIIPTLTKFFQTTYTKKSRLIPGLAYSLKVVFCPDEWRYFYDCVRVNCEGEENLLIPVHAYPVIDDLHIPPRIDLSAVPLGQSVCHAIPLRCTCPIGFEFQVFVVEPHEAFTIHPLTGVIPANGEAMISVTFSPVQYETSQVTFQLVVSQFNTKPYLCTVTGSSAPNLALSWLERKTGRRDAGPQPAVQMPPRSKTRPNRQADQLKTRSYQGDVLHGLTPPLDVCTPAGVAKMLIKDTSKLSSKDLLQALSSGSTAALQSREAKEALFIRKVQEAAREEQANHLKWKVRLGMELMPKQSVIQIMEDRETALQEYLVRRGDLKQDEEFSSDCTVLSSRRVLLDAGQAPKGAPSFQFYTSIQWELKHKAIRLFQQAAYKVLIRCRMKWRLACLKKLADNMKPATSTQKADEENTNGLKISPDKLFLPSFPISSNEDDPLALCNLMMLPADEVDVTVTTQVPFFKLQVPLHYKLMGYQPVSTLEAFNSYIPTTLARPLRNGAPDITVPPVVEAQFVRATEPEAEEEDAVGLSFKAPEALLRPVPANALRIFNPAPGLQTYKPEPKYLETDLEFNLCPMPRHTLPESDTSSSRTQTPHARYLHHKKSLGGVMKWKDYDSMFLNDLSNRPALTAPRRSIDYNTDILPVTAPPPIAALASDPALMGAQTTCRCEGSEIQLTPEMIRAEFLSGRALVSNSNLAAGVTARHQREMEVTHRSGISQMKKRVMTRLKQLGSPCSPGAVPE